MKMKTVDVAAENQRFLGIKSHLASDMTREEIATLMRWCDGQSESLWDDMSLQEMLNVYRVSAHYLTWEGWAEEDWREAYKAWDSAVINPGNKMKPRT